MSNPFSKAAIRREFPVTRVAPIMGADGRINRRSLKTHFSANGCPNASVDLAVAAIKSGLGAFEAIQISMLAAYMGDKCGPMVECIERMTGIINRNMREAAAMRAPNSKWAEDRAARLEGRESRWGTDEFHSKCYRGEDAQPLTIRIGHRHETLHSFNENPEEKR